MVKVFRSKRKKKNLENSKRRVSLYTKEQLTADFAYEKLEARKK